MTNKWQEAGLEVCTKCGHPPEWHKYDEYHNAVVCAKCWCGTDGERLSVAEATIQRVRDIKPCCTVEHASSDRNNIAIRGRGAWYLFCMDCLIKALDGEQ